MQNGNLGCSEGVDVPDIDDDKAFLLKLQRLLDAAPRNSGWQKALQLLVEQEPELTTGREIASWTRVKIV